eukprot:scaffold8063_cov551-Prasinococcus_capsulatus_cf.AAC.1
MNLLKKALRGPASSTDIHRPTDNSGIPARGTDAIALSENKPGRTFAAPRISQSTPVAQQLPKRPCFGGATSKGDVAGLCTLAFSDRYLQAPELPVPVQFPSIQRYKQAFLSALYAEINLLLGEICSNYKRVKGEFLSSSSCVLAGGGDTDGTRTLRKLCRRARVSLYTCCRFERKKPYSKQRKNEEVRQQRDAFYLKLDEREREAKTEHSLGDIWIVSNNHEFSHDPGGGKFTFLGRSTYFGPSSENVLNLDPMSTLPAGLGYGTVKDIFAIRGTSIQHEWNMIKEIERVPNFSSQEMPIVRSLLARPCPEGLPEESKEGDSHESIAQLVPEFTKRFSLNVEQEQMLEKVANWFGATGESCSVPILLLHGPFGTGKSHLLVAAVLLIVKASNILSGKTSPCAGQAHRILVSGATNNAVDRILLGLVEEEFTNFARVGSLRRMDKGVLPFSVHEKGAANEAQRELEMMLQDVTNPRERDIIKTELQAVKQGRLKERQENLSKFPVVGVTCYSAVNEALKGQRF